MFARVRSVGDVHLYHKQFGFFGFLYEKSLQTDEPRSWPRGDTSEPRNWPRRDTGVLVRPSRWSVSAEETILLRVKRPMRDDFPGSSKPASDIGRGARSSR